MNNVVLSTRNIDDLISDIANEVVKKIELWNLNPRQSAESDRWFDLDEICFYIPERPVKPTVYGWVHTRSIPFHKRGKKLYFLKSEIDLWLKEGRKKTYAETAADAAAYVNLKRKK